MNTQLRTALVIDAEAEGTVRAARSARSALDQLGLGTKELSRDFKSAERSAEVFTGEVDKSARSVAGMRAALDPAFAATQRYEQGQRELATALRLGTISAREQEIVLELLEADYRRTTSAIEMQSAATRRLSTVTRGGAGGLQNFSFQLQDVFTQVGMGVPLMISLGQQAPQLLSGFGAVGAVLGVVAAAAFPLAAAIFGLGYESERTGKKVKTLEEKITEAADAITSATQGLRTRSETDLEAIRDAYGEVTDEVLDLVAATNQLNTQQALQSGADALEAFFAETVLDDLDAAAKARDEFITQTRREIASLEAVLPVTLDNVAVQAQIDMLKSDLASTLNFEGITLDFQTTPETLSNILNLRSEIEQAISAGSMEELLPLVDDLREALQTVPDGPLADMADGLVPIEDILRRALKLTEDTQDAVTDLSLGAVQLAVDLDAAQRTLVARQAFGGADAARLGVMDEFRGPGKTVDGIGGVISQTSTKDRAKLRRDALKDEERDRKRLIGEITRDIRGLRSVYDDDIAAATKWREEALANLDPAATGYARFVSDVELIYEQRLKDAYEEDLKNRDDWASGVARGLDQVEDAMTSWADLSEDLVKEWSDGLSQAFVDLAVTGKANIDDLVDHTLKAFAELAYQQSVQPAVEGIYDVISTSIGGIFGQSHTGSEIGRNNTMRSYGARGDRMRSDEQMTITRLGQKVFTPRQMENGQAVVDALALAAGRSSQTGGGDVHIAINNYTAAEVTARQEPDGGVAIDIMGQIEQNMAGRVNSGRGPLAGAMSKTFGLKRQYGSGVR